MWFRLIRIGLRGFEDGYQMHLIFRALISKVCQMVAYENKKLQSATPNLFFFQF